MKKVKLKRKIKLAIRNGVTVYRVAKKITRKGVKYIRKIIKTPRGKMISVILCVSLISGFSISKVVSKKLERKKMEAKVEMYRERMEYLKSEVKDATTEEVVVDPFIELKKNLKGFNVDPFIKDIQAKPQSATYKVLVKNKVEYIDSNIGADHIQLNEKQKIRIMDEIEKEVGRSAYRLFNPLDVTQISGLSEEQFKTLLPDGLKDISAKLYEAEHPKKGEYPINGLFLLAKTSLESSNGTSRLAIEKNNLAGLGAREGEDKNGNGVGDIAEAFNATKPNDKNNPAWIEYGISYKTKNDCMDFLINRLRKEYINPKGDFYNGGTGESNKVSIFDINKKYCTMTTWSYKILDIIEKAEETLGLNY